MKFRTRLVLTLSALTAVTSFASFGAASFVVERSEERQLDEALASEAHAEASELANQHAGLHVTSRGGAPADDIGRLKKYAVLYGPGGEVLDITSSFSRGAPSEVSIRHPHGSAFDFWYGSEHLRGVLVAIPQHEGSVLLLAAPRSDMEKDNEFLRQVMAIAAFLSLGFTVLVTWRVVRRLTRGHEAIAEAARLVADGDLDARVALTQGDDEVVQLAHDVDEMVRRLALLVEGQQRFVAHAAHELRSPLTALYGELQLALRRSRSAEEYKASIEEALDSARRLKALAEDLLALARIGSEKDAPHTPVALAEVAQHAASWVATEATRRHVEIAVVADHSTVIGHAIDLERLLRNLLDNAVRHSPEGGHVWLDARSEGDVVVLSVADDGPGVPEAERDRVFEPFYRAPSQRQRDDGSGLGLAIVREIARVHGGDVVVGDRDGGPGACFRARLPAAPA
ncbi:MAG: putative two-component sensor kinase [Labilithrix sp.]|nr:putative two-component sensor kinase [Labilithrix sp.]